jgi:phosphoglycolate phosphatase
MNNFPKARAVSSDWPQAILFDLDGTLIDSVPDIAAAVNELLARDTLPALHVDEVRVMIGYGVTMLVKRAFAARNIDLTGAILDEKTAIFSGIYEQHLTDLTVVLPGARDILAHYRAVGKKLALVTNKPQAATLKVLEHFGLADAFAVVVGDSGLPRKPEPDMVLHALAQLDVSPGKAVMVGDSVADVKSARAAHVPSILVRGGYTNVPLETLQAGQIINSLLELPLAIAALLANA